jgi:hypothetical protein
MPETDHYPVSEWIQHAINQVGDLYRLLSNDGHTQGQNLALDLRGTLVTMKKHYEYEVDHGFSSAAVGCYAAQWQNDHPKEEGWFWYWHPDIVDPIPMRVIEVRSDTEYRWEHKPERYPAEDRGEEWWRPMPYDLSGPEPPSAA